MKYVSTLVTAAGMIGSELSRVVNPSGASYVTQTTIVTGAFKIKLPVAKYRSNTMLRMTVKIYSYSTGLSYTFEVGGYNYGDGQWVNVFAHQISDSGNGFNVRFGEDGTSNCIWIGELNSTWSYPQVYVTEVQVGYSAYDSAWAADWSIAPVTVFDTVKTSRTAAVAITSNNIAAQSVNYANNAGYADSAGEASYAYNADTASAASYADSADAANSANYATTAGSITNQKNSATIAASSSSVANQIVMRDANGDFYTRYVYSNYLNMDHASTARTADTVFYSSTDNYIRKTDAASFKTSLGLGSSSAPTFGEVYTNGWFRNNVSGYGLYNQANKNHLYSSSNGWTLTGGGRYPALIFRDDNGGTLRGQVYSDNGGFGLLNDSGNWAVRSNYGNTNAGGELYGTWVAGGLQVGGNAVIHAGNIGSQSVNYATSANYAANSSFASYMVHGDDDRGPTFPYPNSYARTSRISFKSGAVLGGSVGNYIGILHFAPWDGTSGSTGDCSYQLAFGSTVANGGNPRLAIRNGINTTWNPWKEIITSDNIGSQSVNNANLIDGNSWADMEDHFSLQGHVHAWGEITGKPTTLSGYGITDAIHSDSRNSRGVTRLYRRDDNSDYSVQASWCTDRSGYWSLRGYSADTYHAGVFVAYAGFSDSAGMADNATYLSDGDSRLTGSYDGGSYVDVISPNGYTVRVGYAGYSDESSYAYNAQNAESANWANGVDWGGIATKPTTLDGFGIKGGSLIQNSASVDFLTLTNQHGASQDKSYIRFKHYTDGRESANIRAEVGYPSNGGWNGALIFSTCPTMAAGTAATDSMVLDKDGNLKLLRGGITANNIKSLTAFSAKSAAVGAIGSATAYTRNITIDGVTVSVVVLN